MQLRKTQLAECNRLVKRLTKYDQCERHLVIRVCLGAGRLRPVQHVVADLQHLSFQQLSHPGPGLGMAVSHDEEGVGVIVPGWLPQKRSPRPANQRLPR